MKKEDLLALNIDEDTAKKVMEMHGATVTKAKAEVDEKNATIADLQSQLSSRDKDLKKLHNIHQKMCIAVIREKSLKNLLMVFYVNVSMN